MKSHYIKEWRVHRGMTQIELATALDMSRPYLSMIERGDRRYDQKFLEAAALVLKTTPADLIARPPGAADSIAALLDGVGEEDRERIEAAIRALIAPNGAAT